MPSDERTEAKLPVQNLVLLAGVVLGAVWLYESPLKSSRPVEELSGQRLEVVGDRRVQARLWQDPFDAVIRHRDVEVANGEPKHPHSLRTLVEEVVDPAISNITVLALLADGAPYADPAESRLRQRYAVLAGLERSGFEPVDGEHIRFVEWSHDSPDVEAIPPQRHVCQEITGTSLLFRDWRAARVPVEWYRSSGADPSQALVLWIKDQDLGRCPLASLEKMRSLLTREFHAHEMTITFKVIGPRSSGTLAAMVSEATHFERKGMNGKQDPLEIHSPWSTAPEGWLHGEKNVIKGKAGVAHLLRNANVSFQRAIATDDELMMELVRELKRRGVAVGTTCLQGSPCGLVALVSEWDTLYGRALPQEFKNAVQATDASLTDDQLDRHIRRYSYLRGLDGELPKEKGKDGKEVAPQGNDKALLSPHERRQLTEQLERPEGRSQLDYVRRLVEVLKEGEAEAQDACGMWKGKCPGFMAIGVLGSDVYDKLLILQALKQNFPHVVFFTTDLDARLFHPRELPWTRNLVVASHFGLTLNKELQEAIPPFRDTYQTAAFYATMRALGALRPEEPCQNGTEVSFTERQNPHRASTGSLICFNISAQPRLHEIGENGPVDLSLERTPFGKAKTTRSIHEPRSQSPTLDEARWAVVFATMAFALGWVLLLPASQTVYGMTRSACRRLFTHPLRSFGMLLMFGVMSWWLWFVVVPSIVADQGEGEPFSVYDGVSIWPSQFLRGAVIVLGFVFIIRMRARLRNACEEVERSFPNLLVPRARVMYATLPMVANLQLISRVTRLAQWCWKDTPWSVNSWSLGDMSADPADIWVEYRRRLKPLYLWGRVLWWSAIFFVVGRLIMDLYGQPAVPFRGNVVWHVNQGLLLAAVSVLIVVIFLVLDLTRMTSAFVRKLVTKELGCASPTDCLTKLQLVGRLTARIDVFVYYPATLLGLMLLARAHYFDNWTVPIGLGIVVGLGAAYVVASAVRLRNSSEEARRQVLNELSERRLAGLQPASSQQIDQIMATIGALREGAFLPYTELPVFRAVALPSGAYGLFTVMELMANSFK